MARYVKVAAAQLGPNNEGTPSTRSSSACCQDRRYSETYRCLGLGGAELVLIGYNTPAAPQRSRSVLTRQSPAEQLGLHRRGLRGANER